jgi:hypothetical protein
LFSTTFLNFFSIWTSLRSQILTKKLDREVDLFDGLDDYLRNPAAFGEPIDADLLNLQPSPNATIEEGLRTQRGSETENSIVTSVDRTKWVKLSHMVRERRTSVLIANMVPA